jgi:transposase
MAAAKDGSTRRSWSMEERQRIVGEALAPNASVAAVARRHGLNANLVFKWIRRAREGWLDRRRAPAKETVAVAPNVAAPTFVPVKLLELSAAATPMSAPAGAAACGAQNPARSHGDQPAEWRQGVAGCGCRRRGAASRFVRAGRSLMLQFAPGVKVYLALKPVDMRRGFDGLAADVAQVLRNDPYSGAAFVFRSKRGDYVKILTWDGSGLCLFAKRLEKGKFVWPPIVEGALQLTAAQLALLIEGIDWRRTIAPEAPERPAFL